MELIVNGEQVTTKVANILDYLESVGIDHRRVAVEHNREILPKDKYETTTMNAGDRIEIVHFVGGG